MNKPEQATKAMLALFKESIMKISGDYACKWENRNCLADVFIITDKITYGLL